MSASTLTPLQIRVLEALAGIQPPFLLFGGGALAAAYGLPRATRDLDLMWTRRDQLDQIPAEVELTLRQAGLDVRRDVTAPGFVRDHVGDGTSSIELDLVADPSRPLDQAVTVRVGDADVPVPTRGVMLVDKLCALLSRAEFRDLFDVEFLIGEGESLSDAIARAPERDLGFSALTLAWILRGFQVQRIGKAAGWDAATCDRLDAFRDGLVERLVALGTPPAP